LLGIFLAALTFVVVLLIRPGTGGPNGAAATASAPPVNLPTVVAAVDIPLGTVITTDMVSTQTLPVTNRDAGVLGDVSQAIGHTTRTALVTGAQVHPTDFQNRAVPITVPPGRRAFSIAVNQLTGVGNLIDVGDSVDIVISLGPDAFPVVQVLADGSITVPAGLNPLSVKIPVLLQDIQVIGTIEPPPAPVPAAQEGQPAPSTAPQVGLDQQKLLILAVTPAQAEALTFVRDLNTAATNYPTAHSQIDITLRSPADAGKTVETKGIVLKSLVDDYGILPPEIVQVPIPTPLKK